MSGLDGQGWPTEPTMEDVMELAAKFKGGNMNAWLIEKKDVPDRCLGECKGVLRFTTPHFAIRYARREDAEAEARAHGLWDVIAVEHVWDTANTPLERLQEKENR